MKRALAPPLFELPVPDALRLSVRRIIVDRSGAGDNPAFHRLGVSFHEPKPPGVGVVQPWDTLVLMRRFPPATRRTRVASLVDWADEVKRPRAPRAEIVTTWYLGETFVATTDMPLTPRIQEHIKTLGLAPLYELPTVKSLAILPLRESDFTALESAWRIARAMFAEVPADLDVRYYKHVEGPLVAVVTHAAHDRVSVVVDEEHHAATVAPLEADSHGTFPILNGEAVGPVSREEFVEGLRPYAAHLAIHPDFASLWIPPGA